jgi:hypothetical protein
LILDGANFDAAVARFGAQWRLATLRPTLLQDFGRVDGPDGHLPES